MSSEKRKKKKRSPNGVPQGPPNKHDHVARTKSRAHLEGDPGENLRNPLASQRAPAPREGIATFYISPRKGTAIRGRRQRGFFHYDMLARPPPEASSHLLFFPRPSPRPCIGQPLILPWSFRWFASGPPLAPHGDELMAEYAIVAAPAGPRGGSWPRRRASRVVKFGSSPRFVFPILKSHRNVSATIQLCLCESVLQRSSRINHVISHKAPDVSLRRRSCKTNPCRIGSDAKPRAKFA